LVCGRKREYNAGKKAGTSIKETRNKYMNKQRV
jgi:hypothetical protein